MQSATEEVVNLQNISLCRVSGQCRKAIIWWAVNVITLQEKFRLLMETLLRKEIVTPKQVSEHQTFLFTTVHSQFPHCAFFPWHSCKSSGLKCVLVVYQVLCPPVIASDELLYQVMVFAQRRSVRPKVQQIAPPSHRGWVYWMAS